LLSALAERSFAPKTVEELSAMPGLAGFPLGQIVEALLILAGAGHAFPGRVPSPEARRRSDRLNRFFFDRSQVRGDVPHLMSPVVGGAFPVSRMEQHLLRAAGDGDVPMAEQVERVLAALEAQGQSVTRDGRALEDREDAVPELTHQATVFNETRGPLLRALGV